MAGPSQLPDRPGVSRSDHSADTYKNIGFVMSFIYRATVWTDTVDLGGGGGGVGKREN